MKYMTRADLRRAAEPVLWQYWLLPSAQEHPWLVDPSLLAREVLGLKLRYRHLSADGDLLGLTSYGELEVVLPDRETRGPCVLDGSTILIEQDLFYQAFGHGRMHFTIGHECAHHVLHRLYPESYGDSPATRRALACRSHPLRTRGGAYDWEEWQMDVLASELLMPEDLVRRNLALAGFPNGIEVLNPVWRKKDYAGFVGLCEMMGVSRQAMAYRLRLLGLLGMDQRACPNVMIDIWMDEEEAV